MDWFKQNGLSIAIAIAGIIATYSVNTALYGYRLQSLEARQDRQGTAITALQANNNDVNVALARIQTSLTYIQAKLDRIVP